MRLLLLNIQGRGPISGFLGKQKYFPLWKPQILMICLMKIVQMISPSLN